MRPDLARWPVGLVLWVSGSMSCGLADPSPSPGEPDAGSGPNAVDAAPRADAGPEVHAVDAATAPPDAGRPDLGAEDAAAPDADPPDLGIRDAGAARDAGRREDAGAAPDAGGGRDAALPVGVPVIVLDEITGATPDEIPMIHAGVELANRTLATECFREFVLAASWTETNGLTQAEIYDLLASRPVTVDVDMFTGTWYQNHIARTVGYEDEPGVVHMNRYFVDTEEMVASNILHEAEGHSQGFSHYGVKATSVPYGLNDAFDACHAAPGP